MCRGGRAGTAPGWILLKVYATSFSWDNSVLRDPRYFEALHSRFQLELGNQLLIEKILHEDWPLATKQVCSRKPENLLRKFQFCICCMLNDDGNSRNAGQPQREHSMEAVIQHKAIAGRPYINRGRTKSDKERNDLCRTTAHVRHSHIFFGNGLGKTAQKPKIQAGAGKCHLILSGLQHIDCWRSRSRCEAKFDQVGELRSGQAYP